MCSLGIVSVVKGGLPSAAFTQLLVIADHSANVFYSKHRVNRRCELNSIHYFSYSLYNLYHLWHIFNGYSINNSWASEKCKTSTKRDMKLKKEYCHCCQSIQAIEYFLDTTSLHKSKAKQTNKKIPNAA